MKLQIDPNSYEAILALASRKLTPELWGKIILLLSRVIEDTNSPLNQDAVGILVELGILYSASDMDKILSGDMDY